MYFRARTYDPNSGRFLQEDPIGFSAGDLNVYRYVGNNPLNYTDPSGLCAVDTVIDGYWIGYDIWRLINDNYLRNCDNLGENILALGADLLGAALPCATGLGAAARAAKSGDKAGDAAKGAGRGSRGGKGGNSASSSSGGSGGKNSGRGGKNGDGGKKPVVIGEDMDRVARHADDIDGHAYRPWGNKPFDFDEAMKRNERWIKDMIKEGREIIDIGPNFERRLEKGYNSPFYEMERRMLKDYQNRISVFERTGKFGGVPGLD